MDVNEFLAQKKASKSVLWVHRHDIRTLRQGGLSWEGIAEYLAQKGTKTFFTTVQQWYARQDWDKIDAELSPKPQAQAVARPAVPRPASTAPTPAQPTQVKSLGLVERFAPNPPSADDDDDDNPAHSVLAKFPSVAKRMQEKKDGKQS